MPELNKEVEDALNPEKMEKEILKEMEDEKASTEGESKEESEEKKEEEEKEEESKEEAPEDPKPKAKDKADDEEEKEDEEEEEEETEEKITRTAKTIPAWKHKISQKKAEQREAKLVEEKANLQQQLVELQSKPDNNVDKEDKFKEVAEETGIDVGVLKKIGGLFEQKNNASLSEQDKNRITKLESAIEDNKQDNLFEKEYFRDIQPLLKDLPEEKKAKIRSQLNKFAFSEEYIKVPLKRIFNFEEFSSLKSTEVPAQKKKKSAERSSSGAKGEIVSMEDLKGKDFLGENQISDKQFDQFLDKVKKGGSRYTN